MTITKISAAEMHRIFFDQKVTGCEDWVPISYSHKHDGGDGMLPNGVGLMVNYNNPHPYVTWNVYVDERGLLHAQSGHYHMEVQDAANEWYDRAGL